MILNQLDCTSDLAEPHGSKHIHHYLVYINLLAFRLLFPFISKPTMTLQVQNSPGLWLLDGCLVPNIDIIWWVLCSFHYSMVPCMLPFKKPKEVIYKHLFSRLSLCRKMRFSPKLQKFLNSQRNRIKELQTVSTESTCTGLQRRKEHVSPIVLFLLSSLSSVLFGMAGVGGADADGGRGARLFFFCKLVRDAPCEI